MVVRTSKLTLFFLALRNASWMIYLLSLGCGGASDLRLLAGLIGGVLG